MLDPACWWREARRTLQSYTHRGSAKAVYRNVSCIDSHMRPNFFLSFCIILVRGHSIAPSLSCWWQHIHHKSWKRIVLHWKMPRCLGRPSCRGWNESSMSIERFDLLETHHQIHTNALTRNEGTSHFLLFFTLLAFVQLRWMLLPLDHCPPSHCHSADKVQTWSV